jgi:hypothetical protein
MSACVIYYVCLSSLHEDSPSGLKKSEAGL